MSKQLPEMLLTSLTRVLEIISSIILVAMMLLTFVDVLGRYLFGSPVFGGTEIISALLALVIFSGLGVANARDDHIVVELFDVHFHSLSPRVHTFIVQSCSIVAMVLVAYVLAEAAIEAYQQKAKTVVLEIPLFWVLSFIALLAVISAISLVAGMILRKSLKRGSYP